MILDIDVQLEYQMSGPTDMILQIQAPDFADQRVVSESFTLSETQHRATIAGEAGMGERILIRTNGNLRCDYKARFDVDRPALRIEEFKSVPPHKLPRDAVRYLMPSRYCPSDQLQSFVAAEYGNLSGGYLIATLRDWIYERFQYVPGSSNGQTTDRLFVETTLQIGSVRKQVEFGLVCRKKMLCRVLLGRQALANDFLVDCTEKHLLGEG